MPPPLAFPPGHQPNGGQRPGGRSRYGPYGGSTGGNSHQERAEDRGALVVRPFAGPGVPAEFDPVTGALRAGHGLPGSQNGFYSNLGGVPVVFYRRYDGRLTLRVGDRTVELDGPVHVEWGEVAWRTNRFAVTVGGEMLAELRYRALPEEMDLGAYIRTVLADPERRARVFS